MCEATHPGGRPSVWMAHKALFDLVIREPNAVLTVLILSFFCWPAHFLTSRLMLLPKQAPSFAQKMLMVALLQCWKVSEAADGSKVGDTSCDEGSQPCKGQQRVTVSRLAGQNRVSHDVKKYLWKSSRVDSIAKYSTIWVMFSNSQLFCWAFAIWCAFRCQTQLQSVSEAKALPVAEVEFSAFHRFFLHFMCFMDDLRWKFGSERNPEWSWLRKTGPCHHHFYSEIQWWLFWELPKCPMLCMPCLLYTCIGCIGCHSTHVQKASISPQVPQVQKPNLIKFASSASGFFLDVFGLQGSHGQPLPKDPVRVRIFGSKQLALFPTQTQLRDDDGNLKPWRLQDWIDT